MRSTYEAQLLSTFGDTATGWVVTIAEARRVGYVLSSTATTSDPEAFDEVQESSSESFKTELSSSLASAGVEAASIPSYWTVTVRTPDSESSDGGGALVIVIVIVILVVIGGSVAACFFCKSCPGYQMCNKDKTDEIDAPPDHEFVGMQLCAAENRKEDPKEEEPTCYINGQPVYKNTSDEDMRKLRG